MALPAEHGGWGLTLEPVLLGLLIAPSVAGVAIGAAALLAFLARTPVKVVLVDRWRHRHLDRTRLAARIAVIEVAAIAGLIIVAVRTASGPFWVPLAVAVPLVGVELWFDMRSRSRRLIPELAGSVGIGSVAAAIVLADGGSGTLAAGAWLVVVARAVASIPFVRFQLRRARHQPHRRWAEDLAQAGAVGLAWMGFAAGWLPWGAAVPLTVLAVLQLVLARTRPPRAVVVGVQQLVLGLAVIICAGLALAST
ncbi:MAG: YwiC-like family protein [Acidimicrobiales bacterium]